MNIAQSTHDHFRWIFCLLAKSPFLSFFFFFFFSFFRSPRIHHSFFPSPPCFRRKERKGYKRVQGVRRIVAATELGEYDGLLHQVRVLILARALYVDLVEEGEGEGEAGGVGRYGRGVRWGGRDACARLRSSMDGLYSAGFFFFFFFFFVLGGILLVVLGLRWGSCC